MPLEHAYQPSRLGTVIMLIISLLALAGALYWADRATETTIRYGMYVISGILIGGIYWRVKALLGGTGAGAEMDATALHWRCGNLEGLVPWEEVRRCVLIPGSRGTGLWLRRQDGSSERVPAACLPDDREAILRVLREEVQPAHPEVEVSTEPTSRR
jgi:hypothetical protein